MQQLAAARRDGTDGSHVEALCRTLFDLAIGGDVAAARVILAYLEGRPVERVVANVSAVSALRADEYAEAERRVLELRGMWALSGDGESGAD